MRTLAGPAFLLASSLLATSFPVAGAELPASAACHTALQALSDAEEALAAASAASAASVPDDSRQRAVAAKLLPQRQRVADACLGGLTTSPPPSQRTWVGPLPARPVAPAAPVRAQGAAPVVSVPLPRIDPPVTLQHCTGSSCLASDGSTLTRVGPNLVGPRGVCTAQGGVVRCP
ncbi:MAG: hypothetical protein JNL93_05780 [Pelomonas sp.]|nr:hypothetical protein [Roseateles sp.]